MKRTNLYDALAVAACLWLLYRGGDWIMEWVK